MAIIFQGICATLDHNPVKKYWQYVHSLAPPPAGGALGDRLASLCLETVLHHTYTHKYIHKNTVVWM